MGICCPPAQPQFDPFNIETMPCSIAARDSQYGAIISKYMTFYGEPPSKQLEKFIQQNYDADYHMQIKLLKKPATLSTKDEVYKRLKTAYESHYRTNKYYFTNIDVKEGNIFYFWSINVLNPETQSVKYRINYSCVANFTAENKIKLILLHQQQPKKYTPPVVAQQNISRPQNNTTQNYNNAYGSSNYQTVDYSKAINAKYDLANKQRTQKINRQTQQWNSYARGKGWS